MEIMICLTGSCILASLFGITAIAEAVKQDQSQPSQE